MPGTQSLQQSQLSEPFASADTPFERASKLRLQRQPASSGRSGFSSGHFCFLPSSGTSAAQEIKTQMYALRGQELPSGQGSETLTFLPWHFSLHPSPV